MQLDRQSPEFAPYGTEGVHSENVDLDQLGKLCEPGSDTLPHNSFEGVGAGVVGHDPSYFQRSKTRNRELNHLALRREGLLHADGQETTHTPYNDRGMDMQSIGAGGAPFTGPGAYRCHGDILFRNRSSESVSYTHFYLPAVCMIHTMKSADLCKLLEKAGWVLTRTRGSHRQYTKDGRTVTVPHPKKDLGVGLVKAIRKQSGL